MTDRFSEFRNKAKLALEVANAEVTKCSGSELLRKQFLAENKQNGYDYRGLPYGGLSSAQADRVWSKQVLEARYG